jgi:hypothetical protein
MNIRDKSGNTGLQFFAWCFIVFGLFCFFHDLIKQGQHDFGHGPELRSYPPGHGGTNETYYTKGETGTSMGVGACFMFVALCVIIPFIFRLICRFIGGIGEMISR